MVPVMKLTPSQSRLTHNLTPFVEEIKSFPTLRSFRRSALHRRLKDELDRVLFGCEWQNTFYPGSAPATLRLGAWNIERGCHFEEVVEVLSGDPILSGCDVLLLTEVDIGMGRSGNRNVAAQLAHALNMNYCFINSYLVLNKGDEGEQDHDSPNSLALHGTAALSRFPFVYCEGLPLPTRRDSFSTFERRLGSERALICSVQIGEHQYDFAAAHLDLKSSPAHRARQLRTILAALNRRDGRAQLFAGDLNTHTFNLANRRSLLGSILYKWLFLGFPGAIAHYLQPELFFEEAVFEEFRRYGFDVASFNDRRHPTLIYDPTMKTMRIKTRKYISQAVQRLLEKKLLRYSGRVPFRLDWMAGRGFSASLSSQSGCPAARVLSPAPGSGQRPSDHEPIFVEVPL